MTDLSYHEYRQQMEKLCFKKARLLEVVNERKRLHKQYRESFQRWRELEEQENKLRDELMDIIPSRW